MKEADLIVIGGGVLGTFHAYHALQAGKRVILLERDQYPAGATVRNFGQAVPSGLSSDWFEFGRRSTSIYQGIQDRFDITVRNNGSVYVASNADEQQLLHELKVRMETRQYPAELLTASQCHSKWPALNTSYCKEGLFFPDEISVEPDKMIGRLLQFCKQTFLHFELRQGAAVVACEPAGTKVAVRTAAGERFSAEKAILCNGHEFKLLFADLFRESGIIVSKLQMMKTRPAANPALEGNILTGLTIRRYESFQECPSFGTLAPLPAHEKLNALGIHILFKKAADGSVIIGDSHEYAPADKSDDLGFGINQEINELMLAEAAKIVTFDVRDVASCWAGFYSQHPEKKIVEYDFEDRIHIRTAIGGKGMTSSAGYAVHSIESLYNTKLK